MDSLKNDRFYNSIEKHNQSAFINVKMLVVQTYIEEFNTLVGGKSFKYSTDNQDDVRSKLEIINSIYVGDLKNIENIPLSCTQSFIQNLHKILELTFTINIDASIIAQTLRFLESALFGEESILKTTILRELSYPVLINMIVIVNFTNNEKSLIDLLRVTKEILKSVDYIDEHNLKLLIPGFTNYASTDNEKIIHLMAEVSLYFNYFV